MYQVIICKNTCRAIKLGILKYLLDSCRSLLYNNNNNIFFFSYRVAPPRDLPSVRVAARNQQLPWIFWENGGPAGRCDRCFRYQQRGRCPQAVLAGAQRTALPYRLLRPVHGDRAWVVGSLFVYLCGGSVRDDPLAKSIFHLKWCSHNKKHFDSCNENMHKSIWLSSDFACRVGEKAWLRC